MEISDDSGVILHDYDMLRLGKIAGLTGHEDLQLSLANAELVEPYAHRLPLQPVWDSLSSIETIHPTRFWRFGTTKSGALALRRTLFDGDDREIGQL